MFGFFDFPFFSCFAPVTEHNEEEAYIFHKFFCCWLAHGLVSVTVRGVNTQAASANAHQKTRWSKKSTELEPWWWIMALKIKLIAEPRLIKDPLAHNCILVCSCICTETNIWHSKSYPKRLNTDIKNDCWYFGGFLGVFQWQVFVFFFNNDSIFQCHSFSDLTFRQHLGMDPSIQLVCII